MSISVIVPTYNRKDELRQLLGSLAGQTLPAGSFEVIVVDDGSTDATWAEMERARERHPSLELVRLVNRG